MSERLGLAGAVSQITKSKCLTSKQFKKVKTDDFFNISETENLGAGLVQTQLLCEPNLGLVL